MDFCHKDQGNHYSNQSQVILEIHKEKNCIYRILHVTYLFIYMYIMYHYGNAVETFSKPYATAPVSLIKLICNSTL